MKIASPLRFAFALILGMSSTARADGPAEDAEQAVLAVIDAARVQAGVPALRRNADLDEAALMHAEDMAENGYVGHESQTTGDPVARVQSVGFASARVGENVGRASTPADAANRMFASDAHRAEMVDAAYTDVGVAVVEGTDGFYVVEVFAAPAAPQIPPPSAADVPVALAAPIAPQAASAPADQAYAAATEAEYGAGADAGYADATAQAYAAPTGYGQANPTANVQAIAPQAQGAPPTVVLSVAAPANVQGYWVQHQGAWWFYAVPAGARPGTVLTAVPGGQGPSNVGTSQLPVTAQAAAGGGTAQHYFAQPSYGQPYAAAQPYAAQGYAAPQPYAAQGYAAPQPYAAQGYAAAQPYAVQRPRPRVIVRAAIGNGRGIFGLGRMRSPRRPF